MGRLANWLEANRPLRIAAIAGLFPLPLLAVASAALLTAVVLGQGWRTATQDALLAAAVLSAAAGLAGLNWAALLAAAAVTWALAILAAHLRSAWSLNLAVQLVIVLAVTGTGAVGLLQNDMQSFWESTLAGVGKAAQQSGLTVLPPELLPSAAALMTGILAASIVASSVCALFLGCWVAERHDDAAFATEFRQLRMGRLLGFVAVGLAALMVAGIRGIADDALIVLAAGFVLQGLAVVHGQAAARSWPATWALALYLPLLIVPTAGVFLLLVLGLAGVLDNGFDLRRTQASVV